MKFRTFRNAFLAAAVIAVLILTMRPAGRSTTSLASESTAKKYDDAGYSYAYKRKEEPTHIMPATPRPPPQMPKIIYGTAWKEAKTADYVEMALSKGFHGIDTACQPRHYNEKGVGDGIQRFLKKNPEMHRTHLWLQTKFTPPGGQDPKNMPYSKDAPLEQQVAESLRVSLANLQTRYLDSWVLHSPMAKHEDTMRIWRVMEENARKKKVRMIGVSNINLQQLEALWADADVKPSVVQNRFYKDTHYDKQIREFCQHFNVQYQSFWTLGVNPHLMSSPTVQKVAHARGLTKEQTLFLFLKNIGIAPLSGTKNPQHAVEDLAILNESPLTPIEIDEFKKILASY